MVAKLAKLFRREGVAIFGTIKLSKDGVDFEAEDSASAKLFDDLWPNLVGILREGYKEGIRQIDIRQVGNDVVINTGKDRAVLRNW